MFDVAGLIGVVAILCGTPGDVCASGIVFQDVYAAVAQVGATEKVSASSAQVVLPRPKPKRHAKVTNTNLEVAMVASNSRKTAGRESKRTAKVKIEVPIIIGAYF